MTPKRRCCAHCPGNPVTSTNREEHECNVPVYISGNLKRSSLRKPTPDDARRSKRLGKSASAERKSDVNNDPNMFSIAKKFHAENLQHQPLPDKVDDRIFMNSLGRNRVQCQCIRKAVERCQNILPSSPTKMLRSPQKRYAPELGCKQPESNMDLAICWEIPVNPVYEPRKPSHVDGSNGGAAPSIFTLIHRNPDMSCGCIDQSKMKSDGKECCLCCQNKGDTVPIIDHQNEELAHLTNENEISPSHDLCKNLDSISISKHVCGKAHKYPMSAQNGRRSKYSRQLRHCTACDEEKNRDAKVRMQSANFYWHRTGGKSDKRSGLPPKGVLVPRPRTPFARRGFCIDTLTPPFSIVNGTRDADYPEHWRLTSIYQQSYKNPKKQRGTILNYH